MVVAQVVDLVQFGWPVVLAVAGPIAGVVYFATQLLTVRKLKREIEKFESEVHQVALTKRKLQLEIEKLHRELGEIEQPEQSQQVQGKLQMLKSERDCLVLPATLDEVVRYGTPLPHIEECVPPNYYDFLGRRQLRMIENAMGNVSKEGRRHALLSALCLASTIAILYALAFVSSR